MASPNKDLGPCIVIWDERAVDGAAVTFSKTFGGVFFRYEELRAPIQRDQAGLTHVDDVTTGVVNPELEVPMTQEEIAKLVKCFGNSEVVAATMRVSNPVGEAVYPLTRQVIVKPIVNGVISTTATEWIYIHRAFPRVTMEQAYDNSGQRTVKVIFKGFPDDVSARSNEMWRYGTTA
ncbi:unnamed protein product [marine sediment metagenome]|uniref:Uncharacterized protein n=1 Tax=marine sediment metagenome TaxID=412755 RepID=X0ZGN9_9ZZZZ